MRNPIRLKNLSARFSPFYLIGLAILVFFPARPPGFLAAAPLILSGLALRSWGAGHLVKNEALTMTGPYAHLRHPLYVGTILVATGFAILFGGIVTIVLVAAIWPWFGLLYFPRKERSEGARLETVYGEDYASYRDAVPALWPRWKGWVPPLLSGADAAPDVFESSDGSTGSSRSAGRWSLERYSDNNELGTVIAVLGGLIAIGLRAFWSNG